MKQIGYHRVMVIRMLFFFILFLSLPAFAQIKDVPFEKKYFPKEDKEKLKEALKNIKEGDGYYNFGSRATYIMALDYYLKANDFNPSNSTLLYKIGNCYLFSLDKQRAVFFLEKAYQINAKVANDIKFLLGEAYFFNQDLEKAVESYTEYLNGLPKSTPKEVINELNRKLKCCATAKKFMTSPERYYIENLGPTINTVYPEYAPVITADESKMLFTSSRDNTIGGERDPKDLFYYEDIYYSIASENDNWSPPIHPGSPLNTEFHDATVGLSSDGQRLLMYRGDNGGDLFESRLKGDEYTEPQKLPSPINSPYHDCSASYSPDMNTLYFVSNRPGGYGRHDIYYCKKDKDNKWGKAVNIGSVINTEYDENGVFMHPDGKTLYFSSQGHEGMGGLDFFTSTFENGAWSEPQNLGFPLNTTDDDVFIVISANSQHGFFASYRPGGFGEKDIYRVTFLGAEKPLVDNNEDNLLASIIVPFKQSIIAPPKPTGSSQLTLLKGTIFDQETKEPLDAFIDITDNVTNELVSSFEFKSSTGSYLVILPSGFNYGIAVRSVGYLFHSENFDIPKGKGYTEIIKNIGLDKIEVGKKIILRNIFFDFDSANVKPSSRPELEHLLTLMREYQTLKIEISGHTDIIGSAEYNLKLSDRRAGGVVDYLVAHGIDRDRLTYKGYGFTQPNATNKTKEGRQLNRRTEAKIIAK